MTEVNGDTVITMTMTQLVGGVVLLVGAIAAVATFTFGSLKSDVADIRAAVTAVQERNADTHQKATSGDAELKTQLADLTAELRVTNAGLAGLSNSVGVLDARLGSLTTSVSDLDGSIKAVDSRLAQSVQRQERFETWVVTRLGQDGPVPTSIPPEWQKAEGDIIHMLIQGDDPLASWFKFTGGQ